LYYHKGCVIHDNQNNGTLHSGPLNIWTPNMDPLFYSTTLLIALYPKIDVPPISTPNNDPQFGTPIWDPDLDPKYGSQFWTPNILYSIL
jgi:hypothetical protein